jgi:hypothetical protein
LPLVNQVLAGEAKGDERQDCRQHRSAERKGQGEASAKTKATTDWSDDPSSTSPPSASRDGFGHC